MWIGGGGGDDLQFTKCKTPKPELTPRRRGTRAPTFGTNETCIFGRYNIGTPPVPPAP